MVYCDDCKPDCQVTIEDFGTFEVHHCLHLTLLNREYTPHWDLLYKEQKAK